MSEPTKLRTDLLRLIHNTPTVFDVHYVDEVKRIAQQALWALDAAEFALLPPKEKQDDTR